MYQKKSLYENNISPKLSGGKYFWIWEKMLNQTLLEFILIIMEIDKLQWGAEIWLKFFSTYSFDI